MVWVTQRIIWSICDISYIAKCDWIQRKYQYYVKTQELSSIPLSLLPVLSIISEKDVTHKLRKIVIILYERENIETIRQFCWFGLVGDTNI